jgi:Family of unknown function (DUF6491)
MVMQFPNVRAHALGLGLSRQDSRLRWVTLAMLCLASAACATTADPPLASGPVGGGDAVSDRLAQVTAAAGQPISSFRYERMSSYEVIGLSDLLVYTRPTEAWLLHLDGECHNIDFGPFLKLTSHMHRVSTLTDSVIVKDNPIPCMIRQIRPVDTAKIAAVQPSTHAEIDTTISTQH